jgi:hypothetical protein
MVSASDRHEPAAVRALGRLVRGGVTSGGVLVDGRTLRWVQAGPVLGPGPGVRAGPDQARQGGRVAVPAGHAIDREHPRLIADAVRDVIAAAAPGQE